jgi:type I restriction enzyme S subunit
MTAAVEPTVRRFKPYPAYKDSGAEWIGEIPGHWEVAPVYARYEVALGKMLDAKRVTGQFSGRYLRNVDVQWDRVNTDDLPEMDFAPSERERYGLRPGDLLVCEGGEVGRTAIWSRADGDYFYQKAIHRVRPRSAHEVPRFLYYLMRMLSERGVFAAGANANTIDHLTAVQLRHYRIPFASPLEQRAIAAFLDSETARIDALVAKKERLIELLQEKRTALITRAVTRGLDPNVPMKDSGVEWLGEIPAHWEGERLRHVIRRIEQGWSPECENRDAGEDEWGVLKAGCVNRGTFVESEHKALPLGLKPIRELEIRPGDLLMSRASGSRDLVGSVAFVSDCRARLLLCDKVFRLHVDPRSHEKRLLAYALNSSVARAQIEIVLSGGSGLANNIAQEVVKDLVIAVPPLGEQRAIVAFVDRETAQLDALVAKVREAIERLKEFRTALISAAVTGKIDVRPEVAA